MEIFAVIFFVLLVFFLNRGRRRAKGGNAYVIGEGVAIKGADGIGGQGGKGGIAIVKNGIAYAEGGKGGRG